VYGFSAELAQAAERAKREAPPGHSGIGTTLTGNLLAMAAMRATLTQLMTPDNFSHMHALAALLAQGLRERIARFSLPWCVTQVGARVEFQFMSEQPVNGSQAGNALDAELEQAIHLALLNRDVMITPFHNMMLICPSTSHGDVARLLDAFESVLMDLT
jgi:glutamate-1-semialdehyde 2,1-aminomutase